MNRLIEKSNWLPLLHDMTSLHLISTHEKFDSSLVSMVVVDDVVVVAVVVIILRRKLTSAGQDEMIENAPIAYSEYVVATKR